jgi:hypothetical protein
MHGPSGLVGWLDGVFVSRAHDDTLIEGCAKGAPTFSSRRLRYIISRSNSTNKLNLLSQDPPTTSSAGASMNVHAALQDLNTGHLVVLSSLIFFVIAGYGVLFSAFLPLTGISVRMSSPKSLPTMTLTPLLDP